MDYFHGAFPYKPLGDGLSMIRLITIQPADFDEPLHCSLHYAKLDADPNYEALSYVWGDATKTLPITLDGLAIEITLNLESALRHLRYSDKPRTLWADALCINQSDLEERSLQVLHMRDIYRKAGKVLVWLGKENDKEQQRSHYRERESGSSVQEAFSLASRVAAIHEPTTWSLGDLVFSESNQSALYKLHELVQRKWFNRIWVLQEAVMASDIEIVCGTSTIPWAMVCKVPDVIRRSRNYGTLPDREQITRHRENRKYCPSDYSLILYCRAA
jgi:hypothetical protein